MYNREVPAPAVLFPFGKPILGIETDEDLMTLAHLKGMLYYTEWDCPEDCLYEEVDGKLIELEN